MCCGSWNFFVLNPNTVSAISLSYALLRWSALPVQSLLGEYMRSLHCQVPLPVAVLSLLITRSLCACCGRAGCAASHVVFKVEVLQNCQGVQSCTLIDRHSFLVNQGRD